MKGKDAKLRKKSMSAKEDDISGIGMTIAGHPIVALLIVVAAASALCIGFKDYAVQKDVSKLWIEDGSVVGGEVDYYDAHSYAVQESETQLMTTVRFPNSGENVLNTYTLDKHLKAAERIRDINVTFNEKVYKYEDVCYSLKPYLFQCTRITVLDCFKEGAYDFPPYNAIYTLDTVLEEVEATLVPMGETNILSGAQANLISTVENLGGANAALAAAGTNITLSAQGSTDYNNALISYGFLVQGNAAAAAAEPNSVERNTALMDLVLATFGTNCSALGAVPYATYTEAYNDIVLTMVAGEYTSNFVSSVEAQLVASIEAGGLADAALAAAGTNITESPAGTSAYNAALISLALQAQTGLTTAQLGDQYDPTLIAMALSSLSLGSISGGSFTSPQVFLKWFAGNGCPVLSATAPPSFLCTQYSAEINGGTADADCADLLENSFASEQLAQSTIIPAVEASAVAQAESGLILSAEQGLVAFVEASNLTDTALAAASTSIATSPQGSAAYNAALVSFALKAQTGLNTDEMGGSASTAYQIVLINIALNTLTSGAYTVENLGGQGSEAYDTFMIDIALQQGYSSSLTALGGRGSAAYEIFALKLYWEQAAASTSGSCSGMNHTELGGGSVVFTTTSEFYASFVEFECPTIDAETGQCSTNSACKCQDNEDGITPYAGRPSFYDATTDLGAQVSSTCYLWDNGLALPAVPTALVLGKPSASDGGAAYDSVEAYEFVLYTDSAEALAQKIAKRPYDPHTLTTDEAQQVLDLWMDRFMEVTPAEMSSDATSPDGVNGYMVNSYSAKTFSDIVDEASAGAYPLLAAGLMCIFLYAFATTGFQLLALGGVCLVVLGTCGGLGLSLWLGIELNATSINVLPFLMLGLGVDDMFLFIRTLMQLKERHARDTPEELVARVYANAGPSVVLTTITNFCAFMIGTLTPLPVVRDFALTAGITVLVSFATDLIGFPALCVLSMKYASNVRVCGCCSASKEDDAVGSSSTKPKRPSVVESHIAPFLTNKFVRVIILLAFCGLWAFSFIGIDKIKMGLSVKQLAKDDSQERNFIEIRDSYFAFYPSSVGSYENDFHEPTVQQAYLDAEQRMYDIEFNEKRVDSWMRQFLDWSNQTTCEAKRGLVVPVCGYEMTPPCAANADGYFDAGEERFFTCLNQWYTETTVTSSPSFFPLSNGGAGNDQIQSPIEFCKIPFYSQNLWETTDYVDLIDQTREVLEDVEAATGVRLFPVGTVFEYWEQYRNLLSHLYKNLGIAVVCTFVIGSVSIFLATANWSAISMRSAFVLALKAMQGSFVMVCAMISTMVGLLGFMGWSEIQLSAIPALTVIASMGICVDLTALLTLFFCSSAGTRDERIRKALASVFVPTLDSMASTIMGCLALAFSPIELYVRYFFNMYVAVALIGTLNGLVLLPVLLAWFGPTETVCDGDAAVVLISSITTMEEGGPVISTQRRKSTSETIDIHAL